MPRASSSLERVLSCLKQGKPVVVPTDTIYGIVADALSYRAVQLLRKIRRPSGKPFIVLIPDPSWAGKLGLVADKRVLRLLSVPGLTLVLEKRGGIFHWLGRESVAVRYPRRGVHIRTLKEVWKTSRSSERQPGR
ncbi:MAG: Sua5/YciO/YrdC/YwlC family protein [Aquificota bacterium]|nr:Sua5/YciO/YrdC/YwlC family protein [Aquificota bacterium]